MAKGWFFSNNDAGCSGVAGAGVNSLRGMATRDESSRSKTSALKTKGF